MLRRSKLLVGLLPLLGPFSVPIPCEVLLVRRDADPAKISEAGAAMRVESALGTEAQLGAVSTEPAAPAVDCWVVKQWTQMVDGRLNLCTEWLCEDGRNWTDCDPI